MSFLCTSNALHHAEKTNTQWIVAMAQRIDFPNEQFQVWEFKPDIEHSALVVTDGDERELHRMIRPTQEFDFVGLGTVPEPTSYWVVRSKDEQGDDIRTLMCPDDY